MKSFQIAQTAFQTAASLLSYTRFPWLRPRNPVYYVLRLWLFQNGMSDRRRPRKDRCPSSHDTNGACQLSKCRRAWQAPVHFNRPGSRLPPWRPQVLSAGLVSQAGRQGAEHFTTQCGIIRPKPGSSGQLGLCVSHTVRKSCTNSGLRGVSGSDEKCTVNSSKRAERACYLLRRKRLPCAKKRALPHRALLRTDCCQTCEDDQAIGRASSSKGLT